MRIKKVSLHPPILGRKSNGDQKKGEVSGAGRESQESDILRKERALRKKRLKKMNS